VSRNSWGGYANVRHVFSQLKIETQVIYSCTAHHTTPIAKPQLQAVDDMRPNS